MDKNTRLSHLNAADAALARGSTIDAVRSVLAVLRAHTDDVADGAPADMLTEPAPTPTRKVLNETVNQVEPVNEDELADDIAALEAKTAEARAAGDTKTADKLAAQTRMVKGADTIVKAEKASKTKKADDEATKPESDA